MNVALVNPFDPVPGEDIRDGRYATFCDALVRAGHRVTWLSSDWSHLFKRRRDSRALRSECGTRGFDLALASPSPYRKNVSLARLRNHSELAAAFPRLLDGISPRPDAVVVSTPPPSVAAAVAEWAHDRNTPMVVDVQDLWPETFQRLWPGGLKALNGVVARSMRTKARRAYSLAAAGLAVAEAYVDHFKRNGGGSAPCHKLYLGTDLTEFDRNVKGRRAVGHLLGDALAKRWIFSGGSLGSALDWGFVVRLAQQLQESTGSQFHVVIAGTGPAEEWIRGEVQRRKLNNVSALGQQPYDVFCTLAAASDCGLSPVRADAFVFFPNRVYDYFAADLALINTIPGELAELVASREAGFTTPSFDVDETVRFITSDARRRPSVDARALPRERRAAWVTEFDRPALAARLPDILRSVVGAG